MASLAHLFAWTCHQLPERSPQFDGQVFPLCFRLAGLYLGVFASFVSIGALGSTDKRVSVQTGSAVSALLLPLLIDGWGNTLHLWSTGGPLRALTGVSAGIALPLLLLTLSTDRPHARIRWIGAGDAVVPSLLGLALLGCLLHPGSGAVFVALAVAAGVGLVLLVANVIWAITPLPRSRAARRSAP